MDQVMPTGLFHKYSQKSGWTLSLVIHVAALSLLWVTAPRIISTDSPTLEFLPLGQGGTHFREKAVVNPSPKKAATQTAPQDVAVKDLKTSAVETQTAQASSTGRETAENGGASTGSADGVAASSMKIYVQYVENTLQRFKDYPALAKRLNQTGSVIIQFKIKKSGEIFDIQMVQASPYKTLNDSALQVFQRIGRFEPMPKDFKDEFKTLTQEFQYRLN